MVHISADFCVPMWKTNGKNIMGVDKCLRRVWDLEFLYIRMWILDDPK